MVYPNPQIYHQLGAIFVHVPKTGGTSIERALRESPEQVVGGHTTALGFRKAFPREFAEYFTFALVRHPLDRFLSAWRYLRGEPVHEALGNAEIHECATLDRWMEPVADDPRRLGRIVHFLPTRRFVCDDSDGVLVDRLYRYERFDTAWTDLADRLGAVLPPPRRLNAAPRSVARPVVDDALANWIASHYAGDYELGGYGLYPCSEPVDASLPAPLRDVS